MGPGLRQDDVTRVASHVTYRTGFLPGRFSARSAPGMCTLERGAIGAPRG